MPLEGFEGAPDVLKHTQMDVDNATELLDALRRKKLLTRQKRSFEKWALEFTRLRKQATTKQISAVLEWYINNLGNPGIPEILSATSFRTKFPQLQAAMRRAGIAPLIESSIEAENTTEDLMNEYRWIVPRSHVHAVVQLSLNAYLPFYARLEEISDAEQEDRNNQDELFAVASEMRFYLHEGGEFIHRQWLGPINERLNRWREWDRNLMRYVWDVRHPEFQKIGWERAALFGSDAEIWDQFVEREFPRESQTAARR